jgi:hypothetical protein
LIDAFSFDGAALAVALEMASRPGVSLSGVAPLCANAVNDKNVSGAKPAYCTSCACDYRHKWMTKMTC